MPGHREPGAAVTVMPTRLASHCPSAVAHGSSIPARSATYQQIASASRSAAPVRITLFVSTAKTRRFLKDPSLGVRFPKFAPISGLLVLLFHCSPAVTPATVGFQTPSFTVD